MAMSDVMIPPTDTPGAEAAKVNEFIDLILTEWATEEERRFFSRGLRKPTAKRTHFSATGLPPHRLRAGRDCPGVR